MKFEDGNCYEIISGPNLGDQICICGIAKTPYHGNQLIAEKGLSYTSITKHRLDKKEYILLSMTFDYAENWKKIYKERFIISNYELSKSQQTVYEETLNRKIILDKLNNNQKTK